MSVEVLNVNAKITADVSGFKKGVQDAEKSTKNFGSNINSLTSKVSTGTKNWGLDLNKFYDKGSGIFKNFGIDIDKFASLFGMSGPLMSAIVACISALVKLGQEMDKAMAEIAKGTGAIGENLTQLQFTAENAMVNGVGRSAAEVGKMVADLNTLFDVQGKDLEYLTDQFDMFAEVTGQDTSTAIKGVSDLMHKWNIDTEDAPKVLDQLTKAGQMSGISVAELTSALSQNQATLSELGYSATQSIALLSSFSKEGINSSNVLTGMKTAMANFAQAGLDGREELAKVVTQIQEASTSTEALSIATETFGARNGAEIVKAFREGGTYAQEYAEALKNAGLALEQTDEASRTSKDAMAELKSALAGTFGEFGQGFTAWFKGLLDEISNFVRMIQPIIQPIGNMFKTVFQFIGNVMSWFTGQVKDYMTQNNSTFITVSSVLKGTAEFFRKALDNMFGIFKNVFGAIFSILKGDWKSAWLNMKLIAMRVAKAVLDVISRVANGAIFLVNKFIQGINKIKENWNKVAEFFGWGKVEMSSELATKDFAEETGLNALIDKAEKELLALKGQKEEIGELGSVPLADLNAQQKQIEQAANLQASTFKGAQEKISADSTTWQSKRLKQQLDDITKSKEEQLKAMREEGASQAELDAVNSTYAQKQIEVYEKIQALKKAGDLEALENVKNAEDEKLQLEEYYAKESADYRTSVETNAVKEKIKIEEKSTAWREKVLQQEIDAIEEKRELEVQSMKDIGKRTKEIRDMQKQSIEEQIAKYLALMEIKKQNDLESAKGAEEKADVEKYYASESADYIKKLWGTMMEETSGQTEKWYKKVGNLIKKVGNLIKKVVDTAVKVVKKGFDMAWKIIQFDPDEFLDDLLKVADTIETFFIETVPRLPGIVDSVGNCIEVIADTITKPEVIDTLMQAIEDVVIKAVDWMTKNVRRILGSLGKLVGAIIRALGKVISEIDWFKLLGEVLGGLWDAIASIGQGLWDGIVSVFSKIGEWISNWWNNLWKTVGNWWNNMWSGVGNWFKGIFGFATGTNNAPSGLALVGERGPELIDLHGGERIYNADSTRDILSGGSSGSSNVWNVTFNNMQDTTAYAMMKQLKQYQTQLAINGVL